jgi:hypothetical protein
VGLSSSVRRDFVNSYSVTSLTRLPPSSNSASQNLSIGTTCASMPSSDIHPITGSSNESQHRASPIRRRMVAFCFDRSCALASSRPANVGPGTCIPVTCDDGSIHAPLARTLRANTNSYLQLAACGEVKSLVTCANGTMEQTTVLCEIPKKPIAAGGSTREEMRVRHG